MKIQKSENAKNISMRIGIDCRKIYDVNKNSGAGIERYTYHFVKNLLKKDQSNSWDEL